MVVGLPLVLEEEPAVTDMVQVLQPLKVADSHAARIDVQVRDDQDVALHQDLVRRRSGRSVGGLGNDLNVRAKRMRRLDVPRLVAFYTVQDLSRESF